MLSHRYRERMTHIAKTSRERFLQAVNDELDRFERRENEFRKKEREGRAKELRLVPHHKTDYNGLGLLLRIRQLRLDQGL